MYKFIMTTGLLLSTSAFAGKVGPAGCGLGEQLFHKDNQVLAATTNGIFWNQTFAISSGTSGCDKPDGQAKLDAFIESNRLAVSNDMARGQGETLASIGQILHCEDVSSLSRALKSNYSQVYPTAGVASEQVGRHIVDILKSNNVGCTETGS